jgi:hypothetical protein
MEASGDSLGEEGRSAGFEPHQPVPRVGVIVAALITSLGTVIAA